MIPSAYTRLASVGRALRETILPAVEPEEALAREQVALAADQIDMLAEQWDGAVEHGVATRGRWLEVAAELVAIADGGPWTQEAREALAAGTQVSDGLRLDVIEADNARLALLVQNLVEGLGADGTRVATKAGCTAVARHALAQSVQDRRWFSRTGMDPDAAALRATGPL